MLGGGVHPTICPEECLEAGYDFVVIGDGERPLQRLLSGEPLHSITGIGYTTDGKVIINPPTNEDILSLDDLPFPDWNFKSCYFLDSGIIRPLTVDIYQSRTQWGGRYYYLTTSRGCLYRCAYCCNITRTVRRNTLRRIMEELNYVKKEMPFISGMNIQDDSFFMGDDAFLANFSREVKNNFGWPFIIRIMPRFVTDERIKLLKEGGLEHVSIGLQGSDRLNRELYQRNENSKSFTNACRILDKYGINYVVDVILDNPYETDEDLREIVNTLNTLPKPFTVLTYSLTLFPRTRILERAKETDLINILGQTPT